MKKVYFFVLILFIFLLEITTTEALIIKSFEVDKIYPGKEGILSITLKNDASVDIEDVSISLDFSNIPLIAIDSSEASTEEILEGKTKTFTFKIKANNDAKPSNYNIPYIITYNDGSTKTKKGVIGLTIYGNVDLYYIVSQKNNILNNKGKIDLKIINKGTTEAKFVVVSIIPKGYSLLSENEIYIGSIDPDDYEIASFDVIYKNRNAILKAIIKYKDFENKEITKEIELPLTVYTEQQAKEIGIIKTNNKLIFLISLILIIFIIIIIRRRNKRKKLLKRNELIISNL
ncbi:MAG: hypothetical protein QW117_02615 [Candidatus Pacearchaeota archaeon]